MVDYQSLTVAEQIWNDVKNMPIQMFALPIRPVSDLCQFVPIDPSRCFLTYSPSSFIPAFEEILKGKYNFETVEKYIILSIKATNGVK